MQKLKNVFLKEEDGAVTVDWVVLTAAIVGVSVLLMIFVRSGVNSAASSILEELTSAIGG
ncbi:hypothetical protein GO499_19610 [Algicella marina]|uniref:Pilus assembly protein n=1 Tax=Algicella marina TaxID=2683284 RepID=A0A6P1T3I6_9RHOB|nr:hypothetical protein GO499_19610 [Algicella marina]